MTQYRLIAKGQKFIYPPVCWCVQRRVTVFGFHLFWWTVSECHTKDSGEQAFAAITTPGRYGERL